MREELLSMLVKTGLFQKEAEAMIATWGDSWFEEGTRVFYIVPPSTVAAMLPLTISPAPAHIARVFVGRVEVLTPAARHAVERAIAGHDHSVLDRYGRFLGPITDQVLAGTANSSQQTAIRDLRNAAFARLLDRSATCGDHGFDWLQESTEVPLVFQSERARSQPRAEVEALDAKALSEVEAMRFLAMYGGDQLQLIAALPPRFILQPGEQTGAVAARAGVFVGHEVIHVEQPAAVQHREHAIAGDRAYFALIRQGHNPISVRVHELANQSEVPAPIQFGTQLMHDLERSEDLVIGLCNGNHEVTTDSGPEPG
ncbi:MAG TPA: hypothetical protein VK864_13900 [Longimicrobiales bacterium]|nr:hypothetical protein [Longimicrobiales bacterium]